MKIFQILDAKNKCANLHYNGELWSVESFLEHCGAIQTATWRYNKILDKQKHTYLSLFSPDSSLVKHVTQDQQEEFLKIEKKINNIIKSFSIANVDLSRECYSDYIPRALMSRFMQLRSQALENLAAFHAKPKEYEILSKIHEFIIEVANYKNSSIPKPIKYNIFGTRTGRLSTEKGSFPIMTLPREKRKDILPKNNLFVEFDYNAAEARTLLALLGKSQPEVDIHEWNRENLFRGLTTRGEAKSRFFSWLYNPTSEDYSLNREYDKGSLLKDYWDGEAIRTPYGRKIDSDHHHALNYLLQSTTSDLVMEKSHEIMRKLEGKKSTVAFSVHDSLILDYSASESSSLPGLIETFKDTRFGHYKVNVKIGKNFLEMRDLPNV